MVINRFEPVLLPGGAADVVGVGADLDVDLVVGAVRPHLDDHLLDAMIVVRTCIEMPFCVTEMVSMASTLGHAALLLEVYIGW